MIFLAIFIVAEIALGGRLTATLAGAGVGAVRHAVLLHRDEVDRQLKTTKEGRVILAKRIAGRRRRGAVYAGIRHGSRTGAAAGLKARASAHHHARRGWAWTRTRCGGLVAPLRQRTVARWSRTWGPLTPEALAGLGPVAFAGAGPSAAPAYGSPPSGPSASPGPSANQSADPPPAQSADPPADPTEPPPANPPADPTEPNPPEDPVMSTVTPATAELGAAAYLNGLDDLRAHMERLLAQAHAVAGASATMQNLGGPLDPGSGREANARVQAMLDAVAAASEALSGWTQDAHTEHDQAVEAAKGANSEALQTYAGRQ